MHVDPKDLFLLNFLSQIQGKQQFSDFGDAK